MDELQKNSLIPVLKDLEHLFDIFNDHFFEGTLKPSVIIASTSGRKNAFGWCTTWKAWTANNKKDIHSLSPTPEELEILNEQDGYYEINLCAEYLNRPFDEVCGTLLHEMVHLYNLHLLFLTQILPFLLLFFFLHFFDFCVNFFQRKTR